MVRDKVIELVVFLGLLLPYGTAINAVVAQAAINRGVRSFRIMWWQHTVGVLTRGINDAAP